MRAADYRKLDPTLPWMGGGAVPRRLDDQSAQAVLAGKDRVALAMMLAYARSYAGALGGVVQGSAAAAVLTLTGRTRAASGAWTLAALAALSTIETRRRARQWEAVIQTALAYRQA